MIYIIQHIHIINISNFSFRRMLMSLFFTFIYLIQILCINPIFDVIMLLKVTCIIFSLIFFPFSSWSLSPTTLYTILLTSCFLKKKIVGSLLLSLKGLPASYLVPKSFRTVHCSEDYPIPWIRNISFYLSPGLYSYLYFRLLAQLIISE